MISIFEIGNIVMNIISLMYAGNPRTSGSCGGFEPRARCAGFSVVKIGNRKERLRVREAGASAAGRGQRPYASFPDWDSVPTFPSSLPPSLFYTP